MVIQPGMVLQSTPLLHDTFFEHSYLLITEVREDGPIGFVLNKLHDRKFNELIEFQHRQALTLFIGGPVEQDKLFFIHPHASLVPDAQPITEHIFLGGDFNSLLDAMDAQLVLPSEVKLLLGYCGWDAGQLESEILEGSWEPIAYSHELIWN